MVACTTTHRVFPDGTRVPTEPCPDLAPVTFGAPRFVIIDDTDGPYEENVAQLTRIGYCYMMRSGKEARRKRFDGMSLHRGWNSVESFGFRIDVDQSTGIVTFTKESEGTATYADGEPRKWHGRRDSFQLTLVKDARRSNRRQA